VLGAADSVLEIDPAGKSRISSSCLFICKEAAMHSPSKDDLPGSVAPVLRQDLLARIHTLNEDYLQLLAAEHAVNTRAAQLQYFSPKLQQALAALSAVVTRDLARTPYTLYSLCFEDLRFWQAACEPVPALLDARYAPNGSSWLQGGFCEVALIYAWQAAGLYPLAARVVYSMGEAVRQLLAAAPLWQIKRIAADYPGLLMPRWPTNPSFWPDLLRFANERDSVRLATTRLLGTQLIAGELVAVSKPNHSSGAFSSAGRAVSTRRVQLRGR
jgi:hypothetical protein